MGQQDMSVIRMGEKFALVQHDRLELRGQSADGDEDSGLKPEVYNSCLIISCLPRGTDDPMFLGLKYFMILTRQRDCYPIRPLEKAFGELRGRIGSAGSKHEVDSFSVGENVGG